MTNFHHAQTKVIHPTSIFSIISLATGIFGWVVVIFVVLTGFTPLSAYFPFDRAAGPVLMIAPAFIWLISLITGVIGRRQSKGHGVQQGDRLAKWGIMLSGIGCILFYGFLLLLALGFYILFSKGYIGLIIPSGNLPF